MNIVTEDLMDKELKAILKAGGYKSEKAVVEHALEVLLTANRALRLAAAVELCLGGEVTLARASEIGGVSTEAFKDHLAEKGVDRVFEVPDEEIIEGSNHIDRFRRSNA